MRLLVLGGTAWLGREVAAAAVSRDHEVTCLARGSSGEVPAEVRFVRADRDCGDAYDLVGGERWDAVVDVARQPGLVRRAVAALESAAQHFLFVSSGNAYASQGELGQDEDAPLLPPLESDVMESMERYGEAKVACEQAVTDAFGADRTLIARAVSRAGDSGSSGSLFCFIMGSIMRSLLQKVTYTVEPRPVAGRLIVTNSGSDKETLMRTTIAAFLFLLIAPVSGCARSVDEAPATGSSDCQQGVRLKGVTYIEVGYLDRVDKVGDKAGEAALGECDDMGSDPAGLNFPDDARTVEVWTVSGADPDEAVARKTSDGLQLFVADSLEEDERTQVVADLGLEG